MNEEDKIYITENANLPELVVTPTKNSSEEKSIEQAYLNRFKNRRLDIPVNNTSAQLKLFNRGIQSQRNFIHNNPWMWGLRGLVAAPAAVAAPLAGSVTKTVLTNPYTDALLTSSAGAHGIQSFANGEADWMTALEIAPMFRVIKPLVKETTAAVENFKYQFGKPQVPKKMNPSSLEVNSAPLELRTTTPQITVENAASMTPEQWTAAQDATIARGDMALAQRLRDLHSLVSKKNNPVKGKVFAHSTKADFNTFDEVYFGKTDEGYNGKGFYFSTTRIPEDPSYMKKIGYTFGPHGEIHTMNYGPIKKFYYLYGDEIVPAKADENYFGTDKIAMTSLKMFEKKLPTEIIVGKPNNIKLANAVTYDDNGVRIPLGKRDNFNIKDSRYAFIPFGLGAAIATNNE